MANFEDERASVEHQAMMDEEFDLLCIAIARLTPQRRKVFILRFLYEYSTQQIADELGISTRTVHRDLARALKAAHVQSAVEADRGSLFARLMTRRRHGGFASQGGPWPEHCVQDSEGAEFHDDLALPETAIRVSKGCAFDQDAYSAFDGTGLQSFLRRRSVRRLWIGGLAEDVCVLQTVLDACRKGFGTVLIPEATRPVDPASRARVAAEMRKAGARVAVST